MLRALLFKYICTAYKSDDDPKEAKRFWGSWDTAQGGVMSINQVKTQTEAVVEVSWEIWMYQHLYYNFII